LVGRRLKLPLAGIGLPGHFICRFQSSSVELYIDPFNRGKLLSKADCVQYLLQGNYTVRDDYLGPISPRRMLLRICGNLHQIYVHLGQGEAATRLQHYLVALAR
jgi:regulator of sirC expression with transglutaminase-like and TPR domain